RRCGGIGRRRGRLAARARQPAREAGSTAMTVTRTVVPGDWDGVLGASVIVLLPPAAKSRVAGLWETVDDGAGFDEVLDALISGGLRELPAFVLVSGDGRDVKVVIRGAGLAEL